MCVSGLRLTVFQGGKAYKSQGSRSKFSSGGGGGAGGGLGAKEECVKEFFFGGGGGEGGCLWVSIQFL